MSETKMQSSTPAKDASATPAPAPAPAPSTIPGTADDNTKVLPIPAKSDKVETQTESKHKIVWQRNDTNLSQYAISYTNPFDNEKQCGFKAVSYDEASSKKLEEVYQ